MRNVDVVIIGGGPAGLTAGIYAARSGVRVVIIENKYVGGQATLAHEIENYPGFIKVSGMDLANKMSEQALSCGAEIIYSNVVSMNILDDEKLIYTYDELFNTKAVILAMGVNARKLNIASEDKFSGKGVSYCATCDGAFYKGKIVAVVGGGNTAIEDAIYLSRFAAKVYLVHRRKEFRASAALVKRLTINKIVCVLDSVIEEILGEEKVSGVCVKNLITGDLHNIIVDGVFVAIGQVPSDEEVPTEINNDEFGYIITDECMRTNIKNVFCAGDIRQKKVRQIVTACADGAIAGEEASQSIIYKK